ncbi:MAG: DNA alkylation repair protein [Candidatus Magasanikbacteria bacterium]|jgi:3-methyladenine DNA glycosylase AlkD|nr:DNA alkylation repair protein [Candidatus Magasanikbacteria bacterium]MBT4314859.1 DNA alkylation repair protein [Candidatus Magasanikbacteria bacterium]MBT4546754.1 DNA alkylation repair protein [Candidatus Magasanikbacteria bacterium]MBT6819637.1 DNA alkylation repair protein [Candidatus Magasanikbacteria bacterium]
MREIILKIRKDLKFQVDLDYKKGCINFFKEPIKIYGVRSGNLKEIGKKYWPEVKDMNKKDFFLFVEELLKSSYNEESGLAFKWLFRRKSEYVKNDFKIFESWLKKYVTNWGKCDDFCTHAFGELILQFPELILKTKSWSKSKNRWLRRASAIIFIFPIRKDKRFLKDIFAVSDVLLQDSDDLVQKGYGWTLKEASNIYQKQVFDFVVKRKDKMPRTALRYAIEKMPKNLKKQAMDRG